MLRRSFLESLLAAAVATQLPHASTGERLAAAAKTQLGVTRSYDSAYTHIAYPGGDVPRATGVCADVIVRAARDGLALDLQKLVHEDMLRDFGAYPHAWGSRHPDASIDHRRVLNLEVFWQRQVCSLWSAHVTTAGDDFPRPVLTGDILTWTLAGHLPHVGIVVSGGATPIVLHNIGRGVEENELAAFHEQAARGHFRWPKA